MKSSKPFKLILQINRSKLPTEAVDGLAKQGLLITPPLNEDFWVYRVAVSKKQAIVAFPKFGVIGCGFQVEKDWNTNLPIGQGAEELYDHISHNRRAGGDNPPKQRCLDAIRLIQAAAYKATKQEAIAALTKIGDVRDAATDAARLDVLSRFLRHTNAYEVAQMFDSPPERRFPRSTT